MRNILSKREIVPSLSSKKYIKQCPKVLGEICDRLSLGTTLSQICSSTHLPDRRTVNRWQNSDPATAKLILNARKIGAWHLFDESLDRLKDATPQNILIEKELAHHIRWTISKLVPEVFGDKASPNVHLSGEKIEVVWAGTTNT